MLGPFRVEFLVPPRRARLLNAPGQFRIAVAGTSFRQISLRRIARDSMKGIAELTYENDNPHDPNAIRVEILGEHVGYLPRGLCVEYRQALRAAIQAGTAVTPLLCPSELVGGGRLSLGVRLDLPETRQHRTFVKKTERERLHA